ncbi:MAG: DUF2303 family protein [Rubricoccaceae bacterium]
MSNLQSRIQEIATEAGIGAILAQPDASTIDSALKNQILLVPKGFEAVDLRDLLDLPADYIKSSKTVVSVEAFRRLITRFGLHAENGSDPGSPVATFADKDNAKYVAHLDYHTGEGPGRCAHTVHLTVAKTPQWLTWNRANKQKMNQVEFAEFIENNIEDIREPSGASVLTAVTHLNATRNQTIRSQVSLENGNHIFKTTDETKGDSTIAFPSEMTLGLAVFTGDADQVTHYGIRTRVRFSNKDGEGLLMWYEMVGIEQVLEKAANEIMSQVEAIVGAENVYEVGR